MTEQNNGFLTPKEVAELLKLHEDTVFHLLQTGKLLGAKIGGSWRIRRSDIDAFWPQVRENTNK